MIIRDESLGANILRSSGRRWHAITDDGAITVGGYKTEAEARAALVTQIDLGQSPAYRRAALTNEIVQLAGQVIRKANEGPPHGRRTSADDVKAFAAIRDHLLGALKVEFPS
jgi:hypothetical protein